MVMELEPGMWQAIEEERLALEKYIADLQDKIARLQIGIGQEANTIARAQLEWQKRQAEQELVYRREELAERRRVTELELATSPIDFVAYELYKREGGEQAQRYATAQEGQQDYLDRLAELEAMRPAFGEETRRSIDGQASTSEFQRLMTEINTLYGGEQALGPKGFRLPEPGWEPVGTPRTDEEIQDMLAEITGATGGQGFRGEFGAYIPTTQQYTRAGLQDISQDEMAIISSFLRAGATPTGGGEEISYNPQDYFREIEEGLVPYMRETGPTRYRF